MEEFSSKVSDLIEGYNHLDMLSAQIPEGLREIATNHQKALLKSSTEAMSLSQSAPMDVKTFAKFRNDLQSISHQRVVVDVLTRDTINLAKGRYSSSRTTAVNPRTERSTRMKTEEDFSIPIPTYQRPMVAQTKASARQSIERKDSLAGKVAKSLDGTVVPSIRQGPLPQEVRNLKLSTSVKKDLIATKPKKAARVKPRTSENKQGLLEAQILSLNQRLDSEQSRQAEFREHCKTEVKTMSQAMNSQFQGLLESLPNQIQKESSKLMQQLKLEKDTPPAATTVASSEFSGYRVMTVRNAGSSEVKSRQLPPHPRKSITSAPPSKGLSSLPERSKGAKTSPQKVPSKGRSSSDSQHVIAEPKKEADNKSISEEADRVEIVRRPDECIELFHDSRGSIIQRHALQMLPSEVFSYPSWQALPQVVMNRETSDVAIDEEVWRQAAIGGGERIELMGDRSHDDFGFDESRAAVEKDRVPRTLLEVPTRDMIEVVQDGSVGPELLKYGIVGRDFLLGDVATLRPLGKIEEKSPFDAPNHPFISRVAEQTTKEIPPADVPFEEQKSDDNSLVLEDAEPPSPGIDAELLALLRDMLQQQRETSAGNQALLLQLLQRKPVENAPPTVIEIVREVECQDPTEIGPTAAEIALSLSSALNDLISARPPAPSAPPQIIVETPGFHQPVGPTIVIPPELTAEVTVAVNRGIADGVRDAISLLRLQEMAIHQQDRNGPPQDPQDPQPASSEESTKALKLKRTGLLHARGMGTGNRRSVRSTALEDAIAKDVFESKRTMHELRMLDEEDTIPDVEAEIDVQSFSSQPKHLKWSSSSRNHRNDSRNRIARISDDESSEHWLEQQEEEEIVGMVHLGHKAATSRGRQETRQRKIIGSRPLPFQTNRPRPLVSNIAENAATIAFMDVDDRLLLGDESDLSTYPLEDRLRAAQPIHEELEINHREVFPQLNTGAVEMPEISPRSSSNESSISIDSSVSPWKKSMNRAELVKNVASSEDDETFGEARPRKPSSSAYRPPKTTFSSYQAYKSALQREKGATSILSHRQEISSREEDSHSEESSDPALNHRQPGAVLGSSSSIDSSTQRKGSVHSSLCDQETSSSDSDFGDEDSNSTAAPMNASSDISDMQYNVENGRRHSRISVDSESSEEIKVPLGSLQEIEGRDKLSGAPKLRLWKPEKGQLLGKWTQPVTYSS